jgi:anti-sigma factor RsiW
VTCLVDRELTALADGTLTAERRLPLLRKVAASPKLARALAQQILAVELVRSLDTPAPAELRERIRCAIQQAGGAAHRP